MGPLKRLNATIGHGADRSRERPPLYLAAASRHSSPVLNSSMPEQKRSGLWRMTGDNNKALYCLVRCARISVGRETTLTTLSN